MSNSPSWDRDQEILTHLRTETGKLIGYNRPPTNDGDPLPGQYAILKPFETPEPDGDFSSAFTNQDWRYVVQVYGQDERQVQWLRDAVRAAWATLRGNVTGAQWARPSSSGAIVPAGERHYVANDNYIVRM